jgi:hypothetical protein
MTNQWHGPYLSWFACTCPWLDKGQKLFGYSEIGHPLERACTSKHEKNASNKVVSLEISS